MHYPTANIQTEFMITWPIKNKIIVAMNYFPQATDRRTTTISIFFRKKNTKNTGMNSVCQLLRRMNCNVSPSNLPFNKKPIPVTRSKWDDLQSFKEAIPTDFHSYYDNLPKNNVTQIIIMYLSNCNIDHYVSTVTIKPLYKLNKVSFKTRISIEFRIFSVYKNTYIS